MRTENRNGEGECYQVNAKVQAVYSDAKHGLEKLTVDGKEVENSKLYTVCMQNYHFNNSQAYLNVSQKELLKSGKDKVVTTSAREVLEEFMRTHQNISKSIEERLKYT
jgi:5'-nucleotidase / UDP-sugar diphosphatase